MKKSIYLLVAVISFLYSCDNSKKSKKTKESGKDKREVNWIYDKAYNELRDDTTYTAVTRSLYPKELKLPYDQVDTYLDITIARLNGEKKVVLSTNNGQFSNHLYDLDAVVTFDDSITISYPVVQTKDLEQQAYFIDSAEFNFIEEISRAKRVAIMMGYYQTGPVAFEFDATGLDLYKLHFD